MNKSLICIAEETKGKVMVLCWRWWWVRWQSLLICFVRSLMIELRVIWMTHLLSQYIGMDPKRETPMLESSQPNQTTSVVVEDMTWYSTSVEEWETMSCFLLFQEIRVSLKKMQKHMVDLRSVESPVQFASKWAHSSKEEDEGKRRLWNWVP